MKWQILIPAFSLVFCGVIAHASDSTDRQPRHRAPPQEAFEACDAAADGDACTVNTPRGGQLSGICTVPPRADFEQLVCVPEKGQHRPPREDPDGADGTF